MFGLIGLLVVLAVVYFVYKHFKKVKAEVVSVVKTDVGKLANNGDVVVRPQNPASGNVKVEQK